MFGTFLLNDKTGSEMDMIKNDHLGQAQKITIAILKAWLQGKGISVSWERLIQTFQKCKLLSHAEQIRMALEKKV